VSGLAIRGALYRRTPRPPWAAHLRLFAREELVLALRSRWTQIFAVVFGVLSFAVAGAGYVLSGGRGVQDFARTAVSLVQLVLLLVPLTALVIGVLSLAPDRGAAELVFSQPVSRRTILLGKLLGLFQALAAAQAVGFGAAGAVVYGQSGSEGLGGFLLLVGASLVTTAVFLGIAALLSAGAVGRKRTRALALALVVWFVAVVLFDLFALGLASVLPSGTASRVLMVSTIVNPIGAVRTGTLLGIEGTGAFGAASLALFRFTRGAGGAGVVLSLSLLFWLVAPTALAVRRLRRADV
jgi:Cu-processing system permease protein